jgi:hypothetical protein
MINSEINITLAYDAIINVNNVPEPAAVPVEILEDAMMTDEQLIPQIEEESADEATDLGSDNDETEDPDDTVNNEGYDSSDENYSVDDLDDYDNSDSAAADSVSSDGNTDSENLDAESENL